VSRPKETTAGETRESDDLLVVSCTLFSLSRSEKRIINDMEREKKKIEKNINTVWTRERNLLYTTGQAAFPAPSNLTQKNQQPPPPPSFQPSSML
jgi:hypothetical protein